MLATQGASVFRTQPYNIVQGLRYLWPVTKLKTVILRLGGKPRAVSCLSDGLSKTRHQGLTFIMKDSATNNGTTVPWVMTTAEVAIF
jgi:hypothetical protein